MISAIISDGKPRRLFQLGLSGKYKILISEEIIDELSGVLGRKKFKMRKEEISNIVTALRNTAEIIPIESDFKVSRDLDDNAVLCTAFDGNADYLVSGDNDIAILNAFKGIPIVSVTEILEIL